ncbi:hypothetical protein ACK356_10785 [Aeromonas veronii]|uniref:hypothetical protein n=1 Tax=Aeromonas TaxID=642 RepID=UPI000280809B|nr:hypothetical protein [Aeromonas veronii]EKB21339.1 hypothetical protein HMPREF1170_02882 [Aeromonas veronii AMC35]MBJ7583851.1 hypothetical protein [Aeromonas veronii]MBL0452118.1 hypothetical protein [Aeromonas veronii]MEB5667499.1 hypothetical protein [Aeromonas veronii]HDX8427751.1 hypothetical protein [Aeromonas veronii]
MSISYKNISGMLKDVIDESPEIDQKSKDMLYGLCQQLFFIESSGINDSEKKNQIKNKIIHVSSNIRNGGVIE